MSKSQWVIINIYFQVLGVHAGWWQFHRSKPGWVGSVKLQLPFGFRSPPSVFILELNNLKQLLLNAILCVSCKNMGNNVEIQNASLSFCWQFSHCYLSPFHWPKHAILPIQNQQSRKVYLAHKKRHSKVTWQRVCGCIIPTHRGREPVSVGIISLKLLVFLT